MIRKFAALCCILLIPALSLGQVSEAGKPVKTITNAGITGTTVFSSDTVYVLNGAVFVENGEKLIIEPGTIIKGKPGSGLASSYLCVARGGKIYAEGTAQQPIIMTAEADNVDNPSDIPLGAGGKGLWGSLLILGNAPITTATGVAQIEGIDPLDPRGEFGGTDPNDNSGVVRYVSLRHGGTIIGAANEINGLTLGGVGRGTTIEYVEAYQNLDDGFEFFGGTVNARYLASVFCDDDNIDWDFGYSGSIQFVFYLKDASLPSSGSRGYEMDYCTPGGCVAAPGVWPFVSNVTGIGSGAASAETDNDNVFAFRSASGGYIFNSIYEDWAQKAINVSAASLPLLSTQLKVENNLFFGFGGGATWAALSTGAGVDAYMNANNTITGSSVLTSISRAYDGGMNPKPTGAGATGGIAVADSNDYLVATSYRGAFDPNGKNWMCDWTASSFYGLMLSCTDDALCNCITDDGKPVKTITNASLGALTHFSADTVYLLNGAVFVENGEQLIIAPGTVIKGNPGSGLASSYLCVARGGQIFALGSSECPIVMTALSDDVDNPTDIPLGAGGKGLWGSLLILGDAPITTATGLAQIEGIDPLDPRGEFGGTDPNDNSGVVQYVSLRHGGTIIGAANEINGLTMGGVGRGTTIHHIEAYQNLDDGFEFFGGTVNASYLASAFCDDDNIDWDFGYSGSLQFVFFIKDATLPSSGSRGYELDYCTPGGCVAAPGVWPYVSNVTGFGSGKTSGETDNDNVFAFRSGSGGYVFNSIYSDWAQKGVNVAAASLPLLGSQLIIKNNLFWDFGAGATFTAISTGGGVDTYLGSNGNTIAADPKIFGISRIQDLGLDPRVPLASPAASGAAPVADPNGYIVATSYRGAFDPAVNFESMWLANWTFLYCGGHIGDQSGPISCCVGQVGNADGDVGESVDITDLQVYIDYLFFGGSAGVCGQEFDTNNDSGVDIADLQTIIDYLFFGAPIPNCF